MYQKIRTSVRNLFVSATSVSGSTLLFDHWTNAVTHQPYINLLASVASPNGVRCLLLDLDPADNLKSGIPISAWVKTVLGDYDIDLEGRGLVTAATTDNGSPLIKCLGELKLMFVPCLAHTLNLALKDCVRQFPILKAWELFIKRVRLFFRSNRAATKLLDAKVDESVDSIRRRVAVSRGLDEKQAAQSGAVPRRLVSTAETRWNTFYAAFSRLWVLYDCIRHVVADPTVCDQYYAHLSSSADFLAFLDSNRVDMNGRRVGEVLHSVDDGKQLLEVTLVLQQLQAIFLRLQQDQYPTLGRALNDIISFVFALQKPLQNNQIDPRAELHIRFGQTLVDIIKARLFIRDGETNNNFRPGQALSDHHLPVGLTAPWQLAALAARFDPAEAGYSLRALRRLYQLDPSLFCLSNDHKQRVVPRFRDDHVTCWLYHHLQALYEWTVGVEEDDEGLEEVVQPAAVQMQAPASAASSLGLKRPRNEFQERLQQQVQPHKRSSPTQAMELSSFMDESLRAAHDQDPLAFWRDADRVARYPVLSKVALRLLSVPAAAAAPERAWSAAGLVLNNKSSSMLPSTFKKQLYIRFNAWVLSLVVDEDDDETADALDEDEE